MTTPTRFLSLEEASRRTFDVCVIGSGASGGVAAATLAGRGLSVLVVEQGRRVLPGTNLEDNLDPDGWAYARLRGKWTTSGHPWSGQAFGGGTIFYAGVSFRYHEKDFAPGPELMGDAAYEHWDLTRESLDPHYDWVEEQLAIAGPSAAEVGAYHFPRYPREELPFTTQGNIIAKAASEIGMSPLATPVAISGVADRFGPGCSPSSPCTSHSCPVSAKADVASRLLSGDPGDLSVVLEARVARLVPGRGTTVTATELISSGDHGSGTARVRAHRFVVAANAIQSAALLLRSASAEEPEGLGNSSGLVGRYLAMKNSSYLRGYVDQPPAAYTALKHRYSSVSMLDHLYGEEFPDGIGGLIYEANPWEGVARGRGIPLQLECIVGDRPRFTNRVLLMKDKDKHGLPRVAIDYTPHRRDLTRLRSLVQRTDELLRMAGARATRRIPSYFQLGSTHLHGTLRAGQDPRTSVTDGLGRLHDHDNVWIVDGSTFPFSGSLNPTLTIQANARRIASSIPL
ncbi:MULTISPECIES: GMC oxidoreductase [Streptomyces]|uniref:GMC oxidoreductase n=1 Tax=Streptomyces TaxID=1883 RepID=UPI00367E1EA0